MIGRVFIAVAFVVSSGCPVVADEADWQAWRGPHENGTASGQPPTHWSLDKNLKWKVEVPGSGSSTPIVTGNQVIVMTAVKTDRVLDVPAVEPATDGAAEGQQRGDARRGEERRGEERRGGGGRPGGRGRGGASLTNYYQFMLVSYERASGQQQWQTVVTEQVPHEAGHNTNTYASASPITDGQRIYANFGSRGIYCLDLAGQLLWSKELGRMRTAAGFGEGASATLAGDRLIVPWDHEGDSFLIALSTRDGQELWRTSRDEGTCWATPLGVEHGGRVQIITNGRRVRSYDAQDGSLIWECGGQVSNPIPSPLLFGNQVICMTGHRGNAIYSIALDSQGDVTGTDRVAWSRDDAAPYVPSATLDAGQIYLNKSNNGIVTSLDARTGEVVIPQSRLDGIQSIYASPVAAAGHVYFTGRNGMTVVIKHGDQLEIVAQNPLEETIDSSLVIVGNTIFARGEQHLFCIAEQ